MNTNTLDNIFNNSDTHPPLFGSQEQNRICENIFLNNKNISKEPVDAHTVSFVKNFAKLNKSDLVQDSLKNTIEGSFVFDLEKETDDCSGIEISHYEGNLTTGAKLQKRVVINYMQQEIQKIDKEYINLIKAARTDVVGTLNILSAVLEKSDESVKEKFGTKEKEIRCALDTYDTFIKSLEKYYVT